MPKLTRSIKLHEAEILTGESHFPQVSRESTTTSPAQEETDKIQKHVQGGDAERMVVQAVGRELQ